MNEFELIRHLTRSLPVDVSVVAGGGDDCAVLDLGLPDRYLLFKTDAVVEGVHFEAGAPARQIGHKALARCLSDFAAMAGRPTHALITLGLPKPLDLERIEAVYEGLRTLAARYEVAVVGGETTLHPSGLLLSVSALGTVAKDRCLLRSGACPGDALFVTGELGGSLAGRHLTFEPRLREAQWLASEFEIHAMIDLSDGLAGDLPHLLKASGVGAELHTPSLPISRAARLLAREKIGSKPPRLAALTDGEDFELLFCVAPQDAVRLHDRWKEQFPDLRLSCIGRIEPTPGVVIRDEQGSRPLTDHGYLHLS